MVVLGLHTDDYPYPVPVNYVWHNDAVYFHGVGSGRKGELLQQAPKVGFTVFVEHGTVTARVACHADTAYLCVMVFDCATGHRSGGGGRRFAGAGLPLTPGLLPTPSPPG